MKAREIFEHVKKHLLTQGKRSVQPDILESCAYRGIDNTKCSIGCLISDTEYEPQMEGKIFRMLLLCYPKLNELLLPEDMSNEMGVSFLQKLQLIHDMEAPVYWDYHLHALKEEYFGKEN